MRELLSYFAKKEIAFIQNDDASRRSSFKIGGEIAVSVFPRSVEQLRLALLKCAELGVKFKVIGRASNILFAFDFFSGALIFTEGIKNIILDGERIYAECGASLTALANRALDASLGGLEFAFGIPGSVGGSVYMNAGAHGFDMSSVIEYTDALDLSDGGFKRIYEHNFDYRRSIYADEPSLICIGASFKLRRAESALIKEKMQVNTEKRRATQPLEMPSAGSYFKRPTNDFAGRLIEECGLKGERVGGAEVSAKHAGFIVNCGNADFRDVLALEEKIKERVASRFGVTLCREVELVED